MHELRYRARAHAEPATLCSICRRSPVPVVVLETQRRAAPYGWEVLSRTALCAQCLDLARRALPAQD